MKIFLVVNVKLTIFTVFFYCSNINMYSRKWPHYAPFEVVIHNTRDDCWVSFLGKVFDITPLIKQYEGEKCIKPLVAMAGKDISHWFDKRTGDIRHFIHPVTGCRVPYCPHGPIPDVSVQVPSTGWESLGKKPWWHDEQLVFY